LSWWCQANQLKSFLTTLLKLKSKLTVLSSHEHLPVRSWRSIRTILHSEASYMNHKENFLHHKELNLGCSVTIRNGAKSCFCFLVYGSQVFNNRCISLFVNDGEMSGTKNWIQFIWNTISGSWIKPSGPRVAHVWSNSSIRSIRHFFLSMRSVLLV